ncbi:hypothetical protein G6F57_022590 [Rhizopus arrhizus]|nr:hypothetical protein G6F63_015762 [Rhizopus arrhizus]KAG1432908.1 hypothetical protein G6F57_022590 [Rhizopus arrhizus]
MIVSSVKGNETNTEETSSLDKEGGKYRQMRRKERPNRRPRAYLVELGPRGTDPVRRKQPGFGDKDQGKRLAVTEEIIGCGFLKPIGIPQADSERY